MVERRELKIWVDESLTPAIGDMLRRAKFDAERVILGTGDEIILERLRFNADRRPSLLVTRDLAMKTDHRRDIFESGASVAWLHINHEDIATQIFVAYTFVFQMYDRMRITTTPRYFDVTLAEQGDLPTVQIATSDFDAPDIG